MTIDKFFGWFFNCVKAIIWFLDKKLCIEISGVDISMLDFVIAFFTLHILFTYFVRSGGVRDD